MPQRSSNKVKVYVRTRPTNTFASDTIAIGQDNRVCFQLTIRTRVETVCFRQLAFIDRRQPVSLIIKSTIGHFIPMAFFIM